MDFFFDDVIVLPIFILIELFLLGIGGYALYEGIVEKEGECSLFSDARAASIG